MDRFSGREVEIAARHRDRLRGQTHQVHLNGGLRLIPFHGMIEVLEQEIAPELTVDPRKQEVPLLE
jgi:hypothetical protein